MEQFFKMPKQKMPPQRINFPGGRIQGGGPPIGPGIGAPGGISQGGGGGFCPGLLATACFQAFSRHCC